MQKLDLSEFIYDRHYRRLRSEPTWKNPVFDQVAEAIKQHILPKWRDDWDSLEDVPVDLWAGIGVTKHDDGKLFYYFE